MTEAEVQRLMELAREAIRSAVASEMHAGLDGRYYRQQAIDDFSALESALRELQPAGRLDQAAADWVRNGIADFVADNWLDRKHTLAEIEAGIRAIEIRASAAPSATTAPAPQPTVVMARDEQAAADFAAWEATVAAPAPKEFQAEREQVQRAITKAQQWLMAGATGEPPRPAIALLWTLAQATLDMQPDAPAAPEVPADARDAARLTAEDVAYPRDFFSRLIHENSPYAFYIFQWVPYQTDAKRWRLKLQHDVRTFDGREALNVWPNGSHCGPFRDDEVEFIRISRSQFGDAWEDPRRAAMAAPQEPT